MYNIGFTIRWKEELVASSPEGSLIFELTMGKLHLYFPDENCWKNSAPEWAKMKYDIYLSASTEWCRQNNIPISIVPNAYLWEEKEQK